MIDRPSNATRRHAFAMAILGLVTVVVLALTPLAAGAQTPIHCYDADLKPQPFLPNQAAPDLMVTGTCNVPLNGTYYFGRINIVGDGALVFNETKDKPKTDTHLWTRSIIVENRGALSAWSLENETFGPFGQHGGTLTIHLYGKNSADPNAKPPVENQGAPCRSQEVPNQVGPCGIPWSVWTDNGATAGHRLPGNESDYFYQYGPLRGDGFCSDNTPSNNGKCTNLAQKVGYFGDKVIGISYGGSLGLWGYKGATYLDESDPTFSGSSWIRLKDGKSLDVGVTELELERAPGTWSVGDEIVVTTTDYLPSHSERLKITAINGATISFQAMDDPNMPKIRWPHNGVRYGGPNDVEPNKWTTSAGQPGRLDKRVWDSLSPELRTSGAETRAAVALLTRSIRIVSEGEAINLPLFDSYGGHLVVRQGAAAVAIRGVEFFQMGQGGRIGHYPIHFHMARKMYGVVVKDSTINESMTRWIVLHGTQGVTLARNVGYKSIGHGFYLEDGTETDNKLYSNIGIFARAAIHDDQNPRKVPGILAYNGSDRPGFPFRSDNEFPSVFWISNGWNDFIGNMAAGAGACGAAYWLVPMANMNMMEVTPPGTDHRQKWFGYSALQVHKGYAGATPLKSFYKNYATSTMHSFQTTADSPDCLGFAAAAAPPGKLPVARAVQSLAPTPLADGDNHLDMYYPHTVGGARRATHCPFVDGQYRCTDPSGNVNVPTCGAGNPPDRVALKPCGVTVLDHFTTSFHWAEGSISAIWLRPQWYVMTNSIVTDVQNGGLTMVSGGDYTHSAVIPGYYGLVRNSIFIGNTRDNSKYPFSRNTGPFNTATGLRCATLPPNTAEPNYCLNVAEGISMPVSGLFTNQRFLNIYDGPFYQDSNAFLDIRSADCAIGGYNSDCMYGRRAAYLLLRRIPGNPSSICYVPNSAIGWKQPNGFFYPPAFLSKNLFFDNVDIRHFVIDPLVKEGTYITDKDAVDRQYCSSIFDGKSNIDNLFNDFSANDRQTTLTDEDGTLTGLVNSSADASLNLTLSVNQDPFFVAPVETAECASAQVGVPSPSDPSPDNAGARNACSKASAAAPPATAKTSPFDHLKAVVYPQIPGAIWGADCANETCYGVPLYRQFLTAEEMSRWNANCSNGAACRWPFIRMAGFNFSQRESLVINNGLYYLDTTVSQNVQNTEPFYSTGKPRTINVFEGDKTYYLFFVYAKPSTVQTYQIYVGADFDISTVRPQKVNIEAKALGFTDATGEQWLTPPPAFDKTTGILTVTVNFSGFGKLVPNAANGLCKPETFCRPDGNSCISALADSGDTRDSRLAANPAFKAESDAVCRNWAMKSLDCPDDGCRGFSFKLPATFTTGTYRRPKPVAFPTTAGGGGSPPQGLPDWTTKLRRTPLPPDSAGGRCNYAKVPGTDC